MATVDDYVDAPNSLDPTTRDLLIRTIHGEAGGQPDAGLAGVAHVIRNRQQTEGFPDDARDVILQPKQFSLWNNGDPAGDNARGLDPNSALYKKYGSIVDGVYGGSIPDPTGGATHYYASSGAGGIAPPRWAGPLAALNDRQIGDHRFLGTVDGNPAAGDMPRGSGANGNLYGGSGSDDLSNGALTERLVSGPSKPPKGDPQADNGLFARLRGGPGALFADDPNGAPDWRDAMVGVGAALMARDNPKGAEAMASSSKVSLDAKSKAVQLAYLKKKQDETGDTFIKALDKGAYWQKPDGSTVYRPFPADAMASDEASPRSADNKAFKEADTEMSNASAAIDKAHKYARMLINGEATVQWDERAKAYVANLTNNAGKNADAQKDIEAYFSKLAADRVSSEKGPATKFKIEQAGRQFLPNGGEKDNAQVASALLRAAGAMKDAYGVAASANSRAIEQFPVLKKGNLIEGKPHDDPVAHYTERLDNWSKAHQELTDAHKKMLEDRENKKNPANQGFKGFFNNSQ